ncbi:uncharacterized protein [Dermacentor albipictus]|uniref:uncharacterized protein n=1 Tax=Dermacentor albipictus TaxID=60249 RepID=UPI0038FC30C7
METIDLGRLNWVAGTVGFLLEQQTGFRCHRYTADSIADMISTLEAARSNGEVALLILLDVQSTFDGLPHEVIENALHEFGIVGCFRQFISSLLTGWTLRVRVGRTLSTPRKMAIGVPQGSVLSPFLFNVALAGLLAAIPAEPRFSTQYPVGADDLPLDARTQTGLLDINPTKLTKTSPSPEDANEKRKVPRRDPLSPRLERRGEAQPMHQALNVQEAMDAETTADCKTAAAAPQPSNQQQQPPQEAACTVLAAATTLQCRLPFAASSTAADLAGLHIAAEFLVEHSPQVPVAILDSRPALQELLKPDRTKVTITLLLAKLSAIRRSDIPLSLRWLPSHVGIAGNEEAAAAKAAHHALVAVTTAAAASDYTQYRLLELITAAHPDA